MRITFDLDNMKDEVVMGKAFLLKVAFPNSIVRYRRSSSGEGGHIEIFDVDISEEAMYDIRYLFGDHYRRICIDASRGTGDKPMLPKQVLFDFKIVKGEIKRAGIWRYL